MPTILAIETSSELASCALLHQGVLTSRESSGVRTHSQSILPMVQALLGDAGLRLADCDALAYGAGPGSFTGVRTATGIIQGLGFGAGLPVLPVVTLAAMAEACRAASGADEVLALLDARMGEVYWARYRFQAAGGWSVIDAPALAAPTAVPAAGNATVCGNGLSAYPQAFAHDAAHADSAVNATIMPHAREIAVLAAIGVAAGRAIDAALAQPLYLRNKIAFTSAERLVINADKAAAAAAAA
ncbi:tRNA (adenosine(37)-N6)-threonylcarbamoyltransferase complex dimerization subunit type 1 TsaB [Massilia sp. PWRC2]|uniref:tRNA (adenosine(37)-N6)-threonylcarbamoyltransferase complex dimerization subunit type 1 TsaB n=1 Tax=Massilia sp. PWRC2 TaxID=2804626 RepID=UPI003CF8E067